MQNSNQFRNLTWASFLILLLVGCTYSYSAPAVRAGNYTLSEKFDLAVELRLSEDFRNAAWGNGDGFVSDISLGNAFSYNAEKLAREIFSNVVITRGLANENQNEIDAILTPKAILIDMPWVQGTWNDTVITAVVEWTLTDSDGHVLALRDLAGRRSTPRLLGTLGYQPVVVMSCL